MDLTSIKDAATDEYFKQPVVVSYSIQCVCVCVCVCVKVTATFCCVWLTTRYILSQWSMQHVVLMKWEVQVYLV